MSNETDAVSLSFANVVWKREITIRCKADWSEAFEPQSSFMIIEPVWSILLKDGFQLCSFCNIEGPLQNADPPVNPILACDARFESQ